MTAKQNPVLGFNFTISLVETASAGAFIQATVSLPPQGGFSECSGLEVTISPESYPEGGNNGTLLKFTNRASWSNIRLRRGVVTSPDLWRWHLDYIEGNQTLWERDPLEKLSADKQLMAFFHNGFWQPMDTLREHRQLESLWESGEAPWTKWMHRTAPLITHT